MRLAPVSFSAGRFKEAEETARVAAYSQEKAGKHALLADALITHGRALARLKRYGVPLFAFRRAFNLSELTGGTNRALEAAMAAFQELGDHLAVSEGGQLVGGRGFNEQIKSLEHDANKTRA